MKKIALASAALLLAAGSAFADTGSRPNDIDRPSTWQNQPASDIDYSTTASITAKEVVAPTTPRDGDAAPYVSGN